MPKAPADLRSLARGHTEMGVKVLQGIAAQKRAPASARVAAVALLFERGWGKAPQVHSDADGGPIQIIIRSIIENADRMQEVTEPQPLLPFNGKDTATD